jgi:hypothetical protein
VFKVVCQCFYVFAKKQTPSKSVVERVGLYFLI